MRKKETTFFSAGLSFILLVFVLLCLITFAVLSLASANADYQYSRKVAQKTKNYYQAESRINHKWKEIESQKSGSKKETITLTESIDETSELKVVLHLMNCDQTESRDYEVQCWQQQSKKRWEPEDTLPVLQRTQNNEIKRK